MTISKLPANASLKQVMDKFEEISFQDFSSMDIITSTELPITTLSRAVQNANACVSICVTESPITTLVSDVQA